MLKISIIVLFCQQRTGKTYTAFQIVYRLLKSGMKKKVLYLADRNILVDQSIQQDFSPLEKTIHKINFAKDDPTTVTSYYLRSKIGYAELTKFKKATAQESISIDAIRNVIIPLPPKDEQKRIVARLEELLPLCERLK